MAEELNLVKIKNDYDKVKADIKRILRLVKAMNMRDSVEDWWVDEYEEMMYADVEELRPDGTSAYFSIKFPLRYFNMLANGEEEQIPDDYFSLISQGGSND